MSGEGKGASKEEEMAVTIKFEKDELLSIIFGLGIADAWEGMKMEKGDASCLNHKGYYRSIQDKLNEYYNNYEKYNKKRK